MTGEISRRHHRHRDHRRASMRPQHNGWGNSTFGTPRNYRSLATELRGVARRCPGVRDTYRSTETGLVAQPIHSQCQTAVRALPGLGPVQERSRSDDGSSYTITGPGLTTVNASPSSIGASAPPALEARKLNRFAIPVCYPKMRSQRRGRSVWLAAY